MINFVLKSGPSDFPSHRNISMIILQAKILLQYFQSWLIYIILWTMPRVWEFRSFHQKKFNLERASSRNKHSFPNMLSERPGFYSCKVPKCKDWSRLEIFEIFLLLDLITEKFVKWPKKTWKWLWGGGIRFGVLIYIDEIRGLETWTCTS